MLKLLNVSKSYGATTALDDLTLHVERGHMLGFVGPNGAGKTTAMRIALGVLAPDTGEVRWDGHPVDVEVRRRFGYLPEERGLYPKMTARRQLRYLTRLHGLPEDVAHAHTERELAAVGLADRGDDRVEALSLGNQQRVQLAAALVHDPVVLVLDEPFSGLDPDGVDVLAEVLAERVRAGAAVVFSSHQLELVERLCDRVAIIRDGRIVASGAVDELRREAAPHRLRIDVEGAPPAWTEGLVDTSVVEATDTTVVVELPPGADEQPVLDAARAAGRVVHFSRVEPSLAELFRQTVAA